jgi:hypothetical protein
MASAHLAAVKQVAPFLPDESKKQIDDPVHVCMCVYGGGECQ